MPEPTLRHVVRVATRRGSLVLWDSGDPCPWNLRKVLQERNHRRLGLTEKSKAYSEKYKGEW